VPLIPSYVKWTGLPLAKTDNNNGIGISGYTAAVILPEGFSVPVEDGSDPYEVVEDIEENNAIYNNSYVSAKAASYIANARKFSFNVAFDVTAKARKLYYPEQGSVLLTLPVKVDAVPSGAVTFAFDKTTLIEVSEVANGEFVDTQTYMSVLNGQEDMSVTRQLTVKTATVGKTEEEITVKNEAVTEYTGEKTLIYVAKVLQKADASKKVVLTKNGEKQYSDRTLAEILGGVAAPGGTLSGDVAIGVLTNDTTATFGFELVD